MNDLVDVANTKPSNVVAEFPSQHIVQPQACKRVSVGSANEADYYGGEPSQSIPNNIRMLMHERGEKSERYESHERAKMPDSSTHATSFQPSGREAQPNFTVNMTKQASAELYYTNERMRWLRQSKWFQYRSADPNVCQALTKLTLVVLPLLLVSGDWIVMADQAGGASSMSRGASVGMPFGSGAEMPPYYGTRSVYEEQHEIFSDTVVLDVAPCDSAAASLSPFYRDPFPGLLQSQGNPMMKFIYDSMRTPNFTNFIFGIIKATNLTSMALFLALKYIYRVRQSTSLSMDYSDASSRAEPSESDACHANIGDPNRSGGGGYKRAGPPLFMPNFGFEYRVFCTAVILACKYLDDKTYTNKSWSKITGIRNEELNRMEREFLTLLNFELSVPELEFIEWIRVVEELWYCK